MKILSELPWTKLFSFGVFSMIEVFYPLLFVPPLRKLFLILFGAKIGRDSALMKIKFFNWHHTGLKGLRIGEDCFIGDETLIDLYDKVIIEDQVTIAQRVTILTHLKVGYMDHPLQKIFPKVSNPVIIKKGSVIGASSTILQGVTIGEKSFIAAGSLVNKNVPSNSLVAGVPAKVIRKINAK